MAAAAIAVSVTADTGTSAAQTHSVHCRAPPPGIAPSPFVMWMYERSGSSWAMSLLNSHPGITMQSEGEFNVMNNLHDFQRMCNYFEQPISAAVRKVRGFKQKFFFCNDRLWDRMCAPSGGHFDALELCLLPNDNPSTDGSATPRALPSVPSQRHALSHDVYSQVGARVVCSLRRSEWDQTLSWAVHRILHEQCGVDNIETTQAARCLERVKKMGLQVDVHEFARKMQFYRRMTQFVTSVCKAQERRGPVFYLWYEELQQNTSTTMDALQRFLGVSPRSLTSEMTKTIGGEMDWISNYEQLERLRDRATADFLGGRDLCENARKRCGACGQIFSPPPLPPSQPQPPLLPSPPASPASPLPATALLGHASASQRESLIPPSPATQSASLSAAAGNTSVAWPNNLYGLYRKIVDLLVQMCSNTATAELRERAMLGDEGKSAVRFAA